LGPIGDNDIKTNKTVKNLMISEIQLLAILAHFKSFDNELQISNSINNLGSQ